MKRYKIALTRSATKELGPLSANTHDKIIARLRELEDEPRLHGSEKLTGIDTYNLRIGNFRIV